MRHDRLLSRVHRCQYPTVAAVGPWKGAGSFLRRGAGPRAVPCPASAHDLALALALCSVLVTCPTRTVFVSSAGLEDDPQAVLQAIRRYIRTFFGCKECGDHFEEMAEESMDSVKTPDQAILWLWRKHNVVNSRLAGKQKPEPRPVRRARGAPGSVGWDRAAACPAHCGGIFRDQASFPW